MANGLKIEMPTKGLDDLFSSHEQREDEKLERVRDIPIELIDDFPDHPFKVLSDESMDELANSIALHGVQTPIVVREKEDGRFEMVSGHRRKKACEIAGKETVPSIVRVMSRDEAIIYMVDANLQRDKVLPSEKAFSYKMKLDAIKRQNGRPPKEKGAPVEHLYPNGKSRDIIADDAGESREQVRRYIRLTELIPEILDMTDDGKVAFRPTVELSYLSKDNQQSLYALMQADECTPSLAQAIKMKQFEQGERLSEDVIVSIMSEEKPNQVEMFKMPKKSIERFFPPGTKKKDAEEIIVKALEQFYGRNKTMDKERDRSMER